MGKARVTPGRLLIMTAVTAALLGWHFIWVPTQEKRQEYRGEIVDISRELRWWRATEMSSHRRSRAYHHYWHIVEDNGALHRVRVPYRRWVDGEEGLPVIKQRGERWPEVDTEDWRDQRERSRDATRMLLDQFRGD